MDFLSPVWLWMYTGAFLMLAELASPGFVVFFFGLAAATVAALKGLVPSLPLWGQLAAFSVLSIFYLLVLRRILKRIFTGEKTGMPHLSAHSCTGVFTTPLPLPLGLSGARRCAWWRRKTSRSPSSPFRKHSKRS